ncbi:MAG TPA: DNA-binding response regulator, partial [Bacteroidales bacterium]|nr:DNA-binding response regulator [Bacteroidales bacterium]
MQEQLTILIIDDEESIRNELAEYLQNNNFKVLMAEAASEALNLLNTYEIDVVFLDIRLPGINGIELLKIIKEEFPQTEIIMISGHGEMQSVIEAMRRGACDFLPKPFSLTEVTSAIERTRRFIDLNNRLKEVENSFNLFATNIRKELGQGFIAQSSSMKKVTE